MSLNLIISYVIYNIFSKHCFFFFWLCLMGFPGGSDGKEYACNEGKDALEKGMATHSSIVAWRIPWTEEPGGLQSIGSQRVGHE